MKTCMYRFVFTAVCASALFSIVRAQDLVGVTLEHDSSTVFSVTAAEEIRFDLVARNWNLDVYEPWDQVGKDVVLVVDSCYAEVDTSIRSWSADPDNYSWLRLWLNDSALTVDSVVQYPRNPRMYYTIPHGRFVDGKATLRFSQSWSGQGIVLSVVSGGYPNLPRQSPPITVRHAPMENLFLAITRPSRGPNRVFLLRRYELVVLPRDRYLNVVSDTIVRVAFTARFPDEFDTIQPGVSKIFGGKVSIKGTTNYFLSSRIRRIDAKNEERQWVFAYCLDDTTILGRTDPYEILDHPPNPFALIQPKDSTVLRLMNASNQERFTWTMAAPQDPYTDIQISMFDPARFSDEVKFSIRFLDAESLTRAIQWDADNGGKDTSFTTDHGQLAGMIDMISGRPTTRELRVVWYVEATDGLYVTESTPPKADSKYRGGFLLILRKDFGDAVMPLVANNSSTLHPNYPNPFNPGTVIPVELPASSYCRLQVRDLMGKEVAVLHDGFLEAGTHRFTFDGSTLPSGVYTYCIIIDGVTHTRSMLLLR